METNQPRIDLKQQATVECENCKGIYFKEVTLLKRVPGLMLGKSEDTLVPFPTYKCDSCGHVNSDFALFDEKNNTNLIN